jgi:ComF family protein
MVKTILIIREDAQKEQHVRALCDVLFPPRCRLCRRSTQGEARPWVCQPCWQAIAYVQAPFCWQCGQPFSAPPEGIASPQHRCGQCLLTPPAYTHARAVGYYQGVLRDLIHALKYQRVYGLVVPLGELLHQHFFAYWPEQQLHAVVPVPLHRRKLYTREFDQALALASYLSQHVHVPLWVDVLQRSRPTRAQVGLNARERQRNVREAFTVTNAERCAGHTLLLLDDVYTTGATVQECARLLRRAGATGVEVYTLARVP